MTTHQALAKIGPPNTDRRRANILAGGVALREWIHAQQGTPNALDSGVPDTPVLELRPEEIENRSLSSLRIARGVILAIGARALDLTAHALRRAWRPAKRWSLRIALGLGAAAIVVLSLTGAERAVARYWAHWKALPTKGTAVLESNPPGSEVLADGAPVGTTPITTELAPGHH